MYGLGVADDLYHTRVSSGSTTSGVGGWSDATPQLLEWFLMGVRKLGRSRCNGHAHISNFELKHQGSNYSTRVYEPWRTRRRLRACRLSVNGQPTDGRCIVLVESQLSHRPLTASLCITFTLQSLFCYCKWRQLVCGVLRNKENERLINIDYDCVKLN